MAGTQAIPGTVVPVGAQVSPGGAFGPQGATGPQGNMGPPGPNAISADAGNLAVLGGDSKIYVPSQMVGGVLRYVSSTALSFTPFNGDWIKINGLFYPIPAGGIVGLANTGVYVNGLAGQNLAASTNYYVYCWNNAGTLTADFSTTAHATSGTIGNVGTEIKSGDDTRTLIGLIRANASSQFSDSPQNRYTRSWLNGGRVTFYFAASLSITATATTPTAAACNMICFANEALFAQGIWTGTATASTNVFFAMNLDGVAAGTSNVTTTGTTTKYENISTVGAWAAGEGVHTVALYANVSAANTATGTGVVAGTVG